MGQDELNVRLMRPDGDPLPIAGVLIDIRFYVEGRFRYQFILGRSDADGVCRASFREIERKLEENRQFFLMDYNTPLASCDSEVGIFAPSGDQIDEWESGRGELWPDTPSPYLGVSNHRVRCSEQKFEVQRDGSNTVDLVCELQADDGAAAE